MNENKNKQSGRRASLMVVLLLALVTLLGRVAFESDVFGGEGSIEPFVVERNGISLSGRLSQGAVLLNGDGRVQMEIGLGAEQREWIRHRRAPTDLVVILDRSGSMEGEKIDNARAAVRELIAQLGEEDRFALVSYSDGAHLTIPLTPAYRRGENKVEPDRAFGSSRGLDEHERGYRRRDEAVPRRVRSNTSEAAHLDLGRTRQRRRFQSRRTDEPRENRRAS